MKILTLFCVLGVTGLGVVWSQDECPGIYTTIDQVQGIVEKLARQVILQQLFIDERARGTLDSGIKQIAISKFGPRPYDSASQTGDRGVAGTYDVSDKQSTLGLGAVTAMLNGQEFRTHQGPVKMVKPSTTSGSLHAVEDLDYPDVPPAVTGTVAQQIAEMKEWFRAFKEQDTSIRDYTDYFKPVLCYLEGAYYAENAVQGSMPFFEGASGREAPGGTGAYLPDVLFDYDNTTGVTKGKWSYRVLCQPLSNNVNTGAFRVYDDLAHRASNSRIPALNALSRGARFQLSFDGSNWDDNPQLWDDGYANGPSYLETMMNQVSGLNNNFGGPLTDNALGLDATDWPDGVNTPPTKDVSKYHRHYGVLKSGAMNLKTRRRGFSDQNLYMAMTTQSDVLGLSHNNQLHKWSYAVPLQVVFLTPLHKWNPYNLQLFSSNGNTNSNQGQCNSGTTCAVKLTSDTCYQTPAEFLGSEHVWSDPADSPEEGNGVLVRDPSGVLRTVRSSGISIMRNVADVGLIRLIYNVSPLNRDGLAESKEVEALKDMATYPYRFPYIYGDDRYLSGFPNSASYLYLYVRDGPSASTHPDDGHVIRVTSSEVVDIMKDSTQSLTLPTAADLSGTVHQFEFGFERLNSDMYRFHYLDCDNVNYCKHPRRLDIVENLPWQ